MANPFPTKFDSACQSCESMVYKGDDMYAADGLFICGSCASEAGVVCACGNFKKPDYETCFTCNEAKAPPKEWDPWAEPPKPKDLPF